MKHAFKLLVLAAGLAAAGARAEQWFNVGSPGEGSRGPLVEVDLDTVRIQDQGGEGVIRLTHDVLHAHPAGFGFRSFVATMHFDCRRRSVALGSAAYYPLPLGAGQRLGADSAGSAAGMPPAILQGIPAATRRALLRATCATAQSHQPTTD